MTRDAEHTPTGYEDAASVVVNQAPAPSSLAGGEVDDVPRDEKGRTAFEIIADCNRESMMRRAGVKDQSREPLLGPPADMAVSRILLAERPEIDREAADLLAIKINDALSALTPRHEAPSPRPELAPYTEDLKGIKAAMLADEAPAEGAGELWPVGSWLSAALDDPKVCDAMKADIREWFDNGGHLRARSSAPEAREGEVVAGDKALAFFKWARDIFWNDDGYEIGGGDFQDAAERLGLIVKVPFDPERHADNVYGLEAGDDWYETEPAVQLALSTPAALKGDA